MKDEVDHLKQLGSKTTDYKFDEPTPEILETFPNQYPSRTYTIQFVSEEFTSLCPRTKAPDYAKLHIMYVPDDLCIETKSLKLYLFSYRNHKTFMETTINRIVDDLVTICRPIRMKVVGIFNIRGGIAPTVKVEYEKEPSIDD